MYRQIDSNKRKSLLLIVIFFVLIMAIGYVLAEVLNYGFSYLVLAFVISVIMILFSYFGGHKVALITSHAKLTNKIENPYVWRLVENLCITAGLPLPKIYIINDPAPNAFATGRNPKHASIALTTGLIKIMENEELEGVIAHELSHVKNYDIRLMTLVVVLVGMLALFADIFMRSMLFGGGRSRGSKGNSQGILAILGIILIILSPIIAKVIQLAISRKREFLADASGAMLTRYPAGLARALEKISQYKKPMKFANNATAHLFIANPHFAGKKFLSKAFSTHPPIEARISALRGMG